MMLGVLTCTVTELCGLFKPHYHNKSVHCNYSCISMNVLLASILNIQKMTDTSTQLVCAMNTIKVWY